MSKLKIYGVPQSRASRALWAARELGLDFEHVATHFAKDTNTPEFKQVNPNARVPAIDDGGFKLFESMAINLYLAKKYDKGQGLKPNSVEEDALATQWSFWVMTELEKPLVTMLLHNVNMRPCEPATYEQCEKDVRRPLQVLEEHLAGRPYLLGDRFTIADLNVASVMMWARGAKVDMAPYPKIADWLKRCISRPAAKG
ncbi:glutathione S-transferase family protein [Desertibaculum subflavum]|uniref:glutathione S-transferase family protein n=1 Tax=Desertibaculum subflavum TaxID=2268458 RepID=UPI000E67650E